MSVASQNDSSRSFLVGPSMAIGLTALLIVGIFLGSPNFQLQDGPQASLYGGDFLHEWLGAYIVLQGDHSLFYDLDYAKGLQHDRNVVGFSWDEGAYLPIVYPPFYYLIVSPLALLPMTTATLVWSALMVICFFVTAMLMVRVKPSFMYKQAWLLPAAVMFTPLIENFSTCQKATFILLILTGTYLLLRRKRFYWAGIVFGLLAFKPQLILVIAAVMLCKKQWRFMAGMTTSVACLIGVAWAALGWDVCLQYAQFCAGLGSYLETPGYPYHKAHCLWGAVHLLLGDSSEWAIRLTTMAGVAATVFILARLLRGPVETESDRFAVQYSGLVIASLLLSPHLFTYDLAVLLLPMALLFQLCAENSPAVQNRSKLILGLLLVLYAANALLVHIAQLTHLQPTVVLMFLLLWAITRQPAACAIPRPSLASTG